MDETVLKVLGGIDSEYGPDYKDYIDRFGFKFKDDDELLKITRELSINMYHDMIKLEVLLKKLGYYKLLEEA